MRVLADDQYNKLTERIKELKDENSDSLKWQEEANALRAICADNDVPCLVERSRSGKGAHVWIFFERAINIKKARRFGASLLDKGAESVNQQSFDTYDRMIPAQDKLPEGGLGNLVALPLQGQAVKNGNSVFVDKNWKPYYDQWGVLKNTGKLREAFIDEKLYSWGNQYSISNYDNGKDTARQISIDEKPWESRTAFDKADTEGTIRIVLADKVYVDKTGIKPRLQNKIRRLPQNAQFRKKWQQEIDACVISGYSITRKCGKSQKEVMKC